MTSSRQARIIIYDVHGKHFLWGLPVREVLYSQQKEACLNYHFRIYKDKMKFAMEIHKLCLFGDVELYKQLSSSIDIDAFMLRYKRTIKYFLYKGAYLNKFFLDLLTKYGDTIFDINNEIYEDLHDLYYDESDYLSPNICRLKTQFKLLFNVDIVYGQSIMCYFDDEMFDIEVEDIDNVNNYGIVYYDNYIFNLFLDNKYVSNFHYDYTEHDILSNTDLAMYLYSENKHIDLCLSRFLVVDFERASTLVKENTFFTFFVDTPLICYDFKGDYLEEPELLTLLNYKQIMLIFFYNILYRKYIFNVIDTNFIEQFDFVEYNILRIIKYYGYSYYYIERLLKTRKIVKLFDIPNKQYLYEEITEIEDISEYEYKCLIYNLNF